MLNASGISKSFKGLQALNGAELSIDAGEAIGLVGPNGSGKSTFLNILSGFEKPDVGHVTLFDQDITKREPWDIAALGVRRTFQQANQPLRMSVMELMLVGSKSPKGATVRHSLLRGASVCDEEAAAVDKARDLLKRLRLDKHGDHAGGMLSGGQQKLLGLGMALMGDPKILMLDEPTAGVNPALRTELAERLRELHAEGMTILTIEHDMRFVADTCDRVYVLDKGSVLTMCRPDELAANPEVLAAYLGRSGQSSDDAVRKATP